MSIFTDTPAGIGVLLAFDAAVWFIVYRHLPAPTSSDTWAQVERNVNLITANVAVIAVNVGLLVIVTVARALLR